MDRPHPRHGGSWHGWLASWTWATLAVFGLAATRLDATQTVSVLTAWSTTLAAWSVSLLCLILVREMAGGDQPPSAQGPWGWMAYAAPVTATLLGPALIGAALIPWNHPTTPLGYLMLCAAITGFAVHCLGMQTRASGIHAPVAEPDTEVDLQPEETPAMDEIEKTERAADEVAAAVSAVVPLSESASESADTAGAHERSSDDSSAIPVTDQTSQWMTRTEFEPDVECVEGAVRVRFAVGQTRSVAHVAFAPPLPSVPEVEVECLGGTELRIRLTAIQTYGLRIEAQRSEAQDELTESIAFSALASRRESHAA